MNLKALKKDIYIFLVTVVTGGFMYYQMPANWLTNPDTVWNAIYHRVGHGGEKKNGRLLQILVDALRMDMVLPVLTTMICIVLLGVIAVLINQMIENDNVVMGALIGLLLLFMPCTSSALTYFYCAESFMLAFMFVILGIYILRKYKGWFSYILSIGLFFISLYLYQAYLPLVFVWAIMFVLTDLVKGKEINTIIKEFMTYVVTSIVAVLGYVVSFKILQIVLKIDVRTDRGFGFDISDILGQILLLVRDTYVNCYEYFLGNRLLNNSFGGRNLINLIIIILSIVLYLTIFIKKKMYKDAKKCVLMAVAWIVFPITLEAITIMSPEVDKYGATGIIMIPTMVCVYILLLMLGKEYKEQLKNSYVYAGIIVITGIFVWNSIVFTGLCINTMQLQLNKTQTVADIMIDNIIDEYGYEPGSKLLVAGSMEDGNFPYLYEYPYDLIKGTSASYGFMWDTYTGNENCWVLFLKQYKGLNFEICDQDLYEDIIQMKEYKEMPLFPEKGSIKEIGETIVVKMSNTQLY